MSEHLRFHVRPGLADAALVMAFDGWNDAGEAATTAVSFLNEAIHSVPLAELDPEIFYDFTVRRPHIEQPGPHERKVYWPENGFRYGSIDSDREIVLGSCVEPHLRWRTYCDAVVEFAHQIGIRRVVVLGAYLADVVYSQPVALTGYSSAPGRLEGIGVASSAYQGPTGIVGVLVDRMQREGFDVTSLWAGLPHYIDSSPNPRGALALLHKLQVLLGFRVDDEPLCTRAAQFEQTVSKAVAEDAELRDYVRRLKRREFAQ